jgi:hypothetical protein
LLPAPSHAKRRAALGQQIRKTVGEAIAPTVYANRAAIQANQAMLQMMLQLQVTRQAIMSQAEPPSNDTRGKTVFTIACFAWAVNTSTGDLFGFRPKSGKIMSSQWLRAE